MYSEEQLHVNPCLLVALVQLPSFSQGFGEQASSVEMYNKRQSLPEHTIATNSVYNMIAHDKTEDNRT